MPINQSTPCVPRRQETSHLAGENKDRVIFILTSPNHDLVRAQKFLDPCLLTTIQLLLMVYSIVDICIFYC